jgi:REP element-mobilizing transposase RayT
MPRKARLSIAGALHHVMARGIEGRNIFSDEDDRQYFLTLLSEGISASGFKCYAWVLMENHYHLLLRVNEHSLSVFMRQLNSKYARWFRKKYHSRGYLFQDRFKSIVTQDQGYIERLVRYIHLNPVRSGICGKENKLENYRWCGHGVILGMQPCSFQNIKDVLRRFGNDLESARTRYREFMRSESEMEHELDFLKPVRMSNKGIVDRKDYGCWVIGDQDFVKKAIDQDRSNRLRLARYVQEGWTVMRVCEKVGNEMGIGVDEIAKRGRNNKRSVYRKIVAAVTHRKFGIPIKEIAGYLNVDSSAVSRMLDDGERLAAEMKIEIN